MQGYRVANYGVSVVLIARTFTHSPVNIKQNTIIIDRQQ